MICQHYVDDMGQATNEIVGVMWSYVLAAIILYAIAIVAIVLYIQDFLDSNTSLKRKVFLKINN